MDGGAWSVCNAWNPRTLCYVCKIIWITNAGTFWMKHSVSNSHWKHWMFGVESIPWHPSNNELSWHPANNAATDMTRKAESICWSMPCLLACFFFCTWPLHVHKHAMHIPFQTHRAPSPCAAHHSGAASCRFHAVSDHHRVLCVHYPKAWQKHATFLWKTGCMHKQRWSSESEMPHQRWPDNIQWNVIVQDEGSLTHQPNHSAKMDRHQPDQITKIRPLFSTHWMHVGLLFRCTQSGCFFFHEFGPQQEKWSRIMSWSDHSNPKPLVGLWCMRRQELLMGPSTMCVGNWGLHCVFTEEMQNAPMK